jgi:hypothetical protein
MSEDPEEHRGTSFKILVDERNFGCTELVSTGAFGSFGGTKEQEILGPSCSD